MKFTQNNEIIEIQNGDLRCEFLETGDILKFTYKDIMINQRIGNALDGSMNNIYLRVYNQGDIDIYPLLGIQSNSTVSYNKYSVQYKGKVNEIEYTVTFTTSSSNVWEWEVELLGNKKQIDLIYGQDISIANIGATTTNELYVCQYLDNKVIKGTNGFVVNSRQNQPQNNRNPYLQQGSNDTEIIGYSTDGMQFFGKDYKFTNEPMILTKDLENRNYQFEFSYTALQTKKIELNSKEVVTFYSIFKENIDHTVDTIEYLEELQPITKKLNDMIALPKVEKANEINGVYVSPVFDELELNRVFPIKNLPEFYDGKLQSFFGNNHEHIVLQEKEKNVERPHGHIISNAISEYKLDQKLISSTNHMYGVFQSQVILGNTTFNKFNSVHRGLVNVYKNTGTRIYIEIDGVYKLLTVPAAYEMGMNYSKWYYKIYDDLIVIKSYTNCYEPLITLEIESKGKNKYNFIITNQLVLGANEFESDVLMKQEGQSLVFTPTARALVKDINTNFGYKISIPEKEFEVNDDRILFKDGKPRNGTLLTLKISSSEHLKITLEGSMDGKYINPESDFEQERAKYTDVYKSLTRNFKLEMKNNKCIEKLNETFWWYSHNAMVHYSTPRGLEQTGGAAWGTRDVCQGPLEYFLMTNHYELSREIIMKIFSNQFFENGEWPQWFMFDEYDMRQDDCHGDVVFWPIKALSDYLNKTKDFSILNEILPYVSTDKTKKVSDSLLGHVKLAICSIKERFIDGESLISYAGGDWDDTLQPANKELKEKLISTWTMALAYQSISQLGNELKEVECEFAKELLMISKNIKNTFNDKLIVDQVIPGFAFWNEDQTLSYMLHPSDDKTGIKYRLLPMTRSIISELVDKKQAYQNLKLIKKHLTFTDGVRLMDHPANYNGGTIKFFQRAEQAANVGREIGLQYCHAHIRYIEAMAKLGEREEVWEALFKIVPMNIQDEVHNAIIRQSNTYFSSSDGAFDDRYVFQDHFEQLKDGTVGVKGGWRIYSSGPGIYLNQLVSNVLGFRVNGTMVEFDPMIPKKMEGLSFGYQAFGRNFTILYRTLSFDKEMEIHVNGKRISSKVIENSYRSNGQAITVETFNEEVQDNAIIEIFA